MEKTISLRDIMLILKRRYMLIILSALVLAGIAGAVSYYVMDPTYQSSAQILVNEEKQDAKPFDVNAVRTNVEMINTYSVIIKSPAILEKAADELNIDGGINELNNKVSVNSQENSQVFSITVKDSDPAEAAKISNTIAGIFQKEIPHIMNVDNVSILSKADENPVPVAPRPILNIAIGLVIGLMIGAGLAFLLEYLDNTIKTEEDVQIVTGLPVLGAIPKMDTVKEKKASAPVTPNGVRSETVES